ncbi:MAG: hypothetical protein U9N59_10345 [Campylobacterota bacterium]|nr:hypothetical protein [Campylobacterota bacterium]
MNPFERKMQKKKEIEKAKQESSNNIIRIEKQLVNSFMNMTKSSSVPMKILFYFARKGYDPDYVFNESKKLQSITLEMSKKDIIKTCGITRQQLKDGIDKIKETQFLYYIHEEDADEWFSFIPHGKIERGDDKMQITMYLFIVNMIKNVSENQIYVNIDSSNMMNLPNNPNTIKFVQKLEEIRGYKTPALKQKTIYLEEFNGWFGTKYRSCYELKIGVLDKIKKDTDQFSTLTFEYKPYFEQVAKRGRPKQLGFKIILVQNPGRQQRMFQ